MLLTEHYIRGGDYQEGLKGTPAAGVVSRRPENGHPLELLRLGGVDVPNNFEVVAVRLWHGCVRYWAPARKGSGFD